NIRAALETHERASGFGWRASTIVLRRWFLEGYRQINPDMEKARRLEELAATQGALAYRGIQVRNLRDGTIPIEGIHLEEPGSGVLPLADEEYRLRKLENRELTDDGRKHIARIYEAAAEHKVSVYVLTRSLREQENSASDLPRSTLSPA